MEADSPAFLRAALSSVRLDGATSPLQTATSSSPGLMMLSQVGMGTGGVAREGGEGGLGGGGLLYFERMLLSDSKVDWAAFI